MDMILVVGIAIVSTAFAILLKQYKPEYSMAISLIGTLVIFSIVLASMIPIFSVIRTLMAKVSFSSEYIKIIMKCLGVCYLTEIASQICKESGQLSISSKVELGGKVAVLIISLPMFEELLSVALELIHL